MEIELPDGTVLDAPDGADPSKVAKAYLAKQKQPSQGGFGRELGRAAVATARDYAQGALGIAALPVDAIYGVSNYLTGRNDMNASQALDMAFNQAGVPQTENPYIRRINQSLGGAASGVGVGRNLATSQAPVTAGVGNTLAASPAQQAAGSIGGAVAAQGTADAGGGPLLQAAAGLGGGMLTGALGAQGTVDAVKRSFRGGEQGRTVLADNIRLFEQAAGRTPSVGQGTQNRRMQAAESVLSRTPGAAGVMAKEGAAMADDLAAGVERQAGKLAPAATPEQAGRAIVNKISGDGGFIDKFKATQGQLYDKLDAYIPQDAQVDVSGTRAALAALNQEIKNAPELSKWFKNSKIQGIEAALETDTSIPPGQMVIPPTTRTVATRGALGEQLQKETLFPEQRIPIPGSDRRWMPYESIKKLRTLVGNEMADAGILSDVPRSKWKALYAALSRDMEAAATQAGPEAKQAWSRANSFTRAGMSRIDSVAHVIDKAGGPEKVFAAATGGTQDGATTLRAVMQSLPKDAQRTLSASVLRRLGRATAGTQNADGDLFSTETFLTNWNRMSPAAKATLFDRYGAGFRADMDKVAKLAANLRQGSQVFRNPSGTAQAAQQSFALGGFVVSLATGNFGTAGAIAGGAGAANLSARLLTNPAFVKWLATNTDKPLAALPTALNQLAQSKDPDLQEAAAVLSAEYQRKQKPN